MNMYAPSVLVTVMRFDGPTARTCAPDTTAPVRASLTTPCIVPVGPRGERSTAAYASSRPSPYTLLFAAVPPQLESGVSIAVWSRMERVQATSPMSGGAADHISATTPATCGVAIDVPLKAAYMLPGIELRTFAPGAEMFGLT